MKLIEETKYLNKEYVYRYYAQIVPKFKEYEKITRKEMLKQIIELYQNPEFIIDICSYREIELLKKVLNKKINFSDIRSNYDFEYTNLIHKFLLLYGFNEVCYIPEEFILSVKQAIKLVNKEEKLKSDKINDILIGLIKIYGVIDEGPLVELCDNVYDLNRENILEHIHTNKYFKVYTWQIKLDSFTAYMYEPYYYFDEELIKAVYYKEQGRLFCPRPLEEVIFLRYHQFDYREETINKFISEVEKLPFYHTSLYEMIEYYAALNLDRKALKEKFKSIPILKHSDLTELIKLMDAAMDDMPSAALDGHTPSEYAFIRSKQEFDDNYQNNYDKLKKSEEIQKYKKVHEQVDKLQNECINYIFAEKQNELKTFEKLLNKNNLSFKFDDNNALGNLLMFNFNLNGRTLFEEFVENKIMILSTDYYIATQMQDTYTESLFIIKGLNPKNGTVKLKDMFSNKEYDMTDIALSCSDNNIIGSYIYTSLVTVSGFIVGLGYAFIFVKNNHENIVEEINETVKNMKAIIDDKTKKFIACFQLFKKEKIYFVHRPL